MPNQFCVYPRSFVPTSSFLSAAFSQTSNEILLSTFLNYSSSSRWILNNHLNSVLFPTFVLFCFVFLNFSLFVYFPDDITPSPEFLLNYGL